MASTGRLVLLSRLLGRRTICLSGLLLFESDLLWWFASLLVAEVVLVSLMSDANVKPFIRASVILCFGN